MKIMENLFNFAKMLIDNIYMGVAYNGKLMFGKFYFS